MNISDFRLTNARELKAAVHELGFLPMFENKVKGFSVEEHTPDEFWFKDGVDGPWEWKEQVLDAELAYGKFFNNRAGFIDRAWLPHFCNFRRDGYDFEGFYEDGLTSYQSKEIIDYLSENGAQLSRVLKAACGYVKDGKKGFDAVITGLQMRTFVTTKSFEYNIDKHGNRYGWGISRYALMEEIFGEDFINSADKTSPAESKALVLEQMRKICPQAQEKQLERLVRG